MEPKFKPTAAESSSSPHGDEPGSPFFTVCTEKISWQDQITIILLSSFPCFVLFFLSPFPFFQMSSLKNP